MLYAIKDIESDGWLVMALVNARYVIISRVENANGDAERLAKLFAAAPLMFDTLNLCLEDAERQIKADAPGVSPDWYGDVRNAINHVEV